jgi:hypothetical protein
MYVCTNQIYICLNIRITCVSVYMQLVGAAKGNLKILQVSLITPQVDILSAYSFSFSVVCTNHHSMVCCCTVTERHHRDDQQPSQCRVDCWAQSRVGGLYCKYQHPLPALANEPFFLSVCWPQNHLLVYRLSNLSISWEWSQHLRAYLLVFQPKLTQGQRCSPRNSTPELSGLVAAQLGTYLVSSTK